MEDLIDIEGLDHIGWLPFAVGWWILLAVVSGVIIAAVFFYIKKTKYRKSWQYRSYCRLQYINSQIGAMGYKYLLQNLSIEMRKIGMATTKREICAGLTGDRWLKWLHENDPSGFDWVENGRILLNVQYMPDIEPVENDDVLGNMHKLIAAAKNWVRKC